VTDEAHIGRETPAGLMQAPLGHPRLHLRVTDSTNDRARALALAGAPHGTLVTAAEQTAGRGRQGRRWSAPAGQALLCSLVLRAGHIWESAGLDRAGSPIDEREGKGRTTLLVDVGGNPSHTAPQPIEESTGLPPLLSLIAAVAVCDVVGEQAMVKWPNDIVIVRAWEDTASPGLAKLAGILVESRPQEGWAVLGIGLNVAVRLDELPADVRAGAATMGESLAAIEPALARLLGVLERRLGEPAESVLDAYRARDALRGRDVAWGPPGPQGRIGSGRAEGIDGRGRLLVTLDEGGSIALDAGEVHLRL